MRMYELAVCGSLNKLRPNTIIIRLIATLIIILGNTDTEFALFVSSI